MNPRNEAETRQPEKSAFPRLSKDAATGCMSMTGV
jgi:hypothetical protein